MYVNWKNIHIYEFKKRQRVKMKIKHTLKISLLALFLTVFTTGCLDMLFQNTNLMQNQFGSSSEDLGIDLDDNDSALMEEGPLPLPVTMSKLDAVDPGNVIVTAEPVTDVATLPGVRTAHADVTCEAGDLCEVTVRGLANAVSDPSVTPYVLVYYDDDTYEIGTVNANGSFAALSINVPMDEDLEITDHILITRLTDDNLTSSLASYPLYVQVEAGGNVIFTLTNADSSFDTSILYSDNLGYLYFAAQNADDTWDLWRHGEAGETALLLIDDALDSVLAITALSENEIIVFFQSGDVQTIEISEAVAQNLSLVRKAYAKDDEPSVATRDGFTITLPPALITHQITQGEGIPYKLLPFDDAGFVLSKPATDNSSYLAAYMSFDGELTVPIVPYDPEELDFPYQAELAVSGDYIYIVSFFRVYSQINQDFVTRQELSRIEITDKALTESSAENFWPEREVLETSIPFSVLEVDAKDDVFVYSAQNDLNEIEFLRYDGVKKEFILTYNSNNSTLPDNLEMTSGVVISPNGKLVFACATEFAESDADLSDSALDALKKSRGAKIVVHDFDDDPGIFTVILNDVDVDTCPSGLSITNDYKMYYFRKPLINSNDEEIPSQLTYIDLYSIEGLESALPAR